MNQIGIGIGIVMDMIVLSGPLCSMHGFVIDIIVLSGPQLCWNLRHGVRRPLRHILVVADGHVYKPV